MPSTRQRVRGYVDDRVHRLLMLAVAKPDVTISSVVNSALDHWLSKERVNDQLGAMIRRLDMLQREQETLAHRQIVALEAHGLFVRHFLSTFPALPDEELGHAKAEGARRYKLYRQALKLVLEESARGFLTNLEDVVSDESAFFTAEELERLRVPLPLQATNDGEVLHG